MPITISPILMCLGMSVSCRLRRFGEALNGIYDCVGNARLESAVQERLRIHGVVEIPEFQEQRGHGGTAQDCQWRCPDRKLPSGNGFEQFFLKNTCSTGASLPMRTVSEIPGQEQLVPRKGLRECGAKVFFHD